MHFDLWNFLGGLVSGLVGGSLITWQITKTLRAGTNGNAIDQSKARAGGDIIGRDKH